MANGLVSGRIEAYKIEVLKEILEPMILRLIKLQNLTDVVNTLQTITLLLKKQNINLKESV